MQNQQNKIPLNVYSMDQADIATMKNINTIEYYNKIDNYRLSSDIVPKSLQEFEERIEIKGIYSDEEKSKALIKLVSGKFSPKVSLTDFLNLIEKLDIKDVSLRTQAMTNFLEGSNNNCDFSSDVPPLQNLKDMFGENIGGKTHDYMLRKKNEPMITSPDEASSITPAVPVVKRVDQFEALRSKEKEKKEEEIKPISDSDMEILTKTTSVRDRVTAFEEMIQPLNKKPSTGQKSGVLPWTPTTIVDGEKIGEAERRKLQEIVLQSKSGSADLNIYGGGTQVFPDNPSPQIVPSEEATQNSSSLLKRLRDNSNCCGIS